MATRTGTSVVDGFPTLAVTGPAMLVAGKTADVVTTLLGLYLVGGASELSPVAGLFDVFGTVPTVVGMSLAVVLLVVTVTEFAVGVCRETAPRYVPLVRGVAYLPLTLLWTAVAVRNAQLIIAAA